MLLGNCKQAVIRRLMTKKKREKIYVKTNQIKAHISILLSEKWKSRQNLLQR